MKNFEVTDKDTNKKYWISRSIAILALVIVEDDPIIEESIMSTCSSDENGVHTQKVSRVTGYRKKYVLVNKRGEGTPNFQGYWNIPVGYLDYDETLTEACTREVMEEQGVFIPSNRWSPYLPIDDKIVEGDTKQNVTIRFRTVLTMDEYERAFNAGRFKQTNYIGEDNEVKERELMLLTQENVDSKQWAFNHKELLEYELGPMVYVL